mmetsp:Transcript_74078/g.199724  ORF Transcript_74078/g.199724 Transcript_74078/m.199724 type:complete len:263 (+) Transcript_74078:673-1461(+)
MPWGAGAERDEGLVQHAAVLLRCIARERPSNPQRGGLPTAAEPQRTEFLRLHEVRQQPPVLGARRVPREEAEDRPHLVNDPRRGRRRHRGAAHADLGAPEGHPERPSAPEGTARQVVVPEDEVEIHVIQTLNFGQTRPGHVPEVRQAHARLPRPEPPKRGPQQRRLRRRSATWGRVEDQQRARHVRGQAQAGVMHEHLAARPGREQTVKPRRLRVNARMLQRDRRVPRRQSQHVRDVVKRCVRDRRAPDVSQNEAVQAVLGS